MRLLYCYIMFLDEIGNSKPYRGLDVIELNLSTVDKFSYDSITNTLCRKNREKPLPINFWADDSVDADNHNIYNINVIAGENGSGKTTAIHCVINLLDYLHAVVDDTVSKTHRKDLSREATNRVLLLFEKSGKKYALDYTPTEWDKRGLVNLTGFLNERPNVFSFHNWETFAYQRNITRDEIAAIILKTKVIYLTNTLNQYDYERHIGERNERLRDFFVYDASVGSTIGPDVSKFFPYEVFKQVKYVFDKRQVAKRKTIQGSIPELRMPHGMVLHLLLEKYQEVFSRSIFPLIGAENDAVAEDDQITPSRLDLPILLGILCVASFIDNLGKVVEVDLLPIIKNNKTKKISPEMSLLQELENAISETESAFYHALNYIKLQGHTGIISCLSTLPNGRLISGSFDGTLRIWDPKKSGMCMNTLDSHSSRITCMNVLPDGRVVTGHSDSNLRVWDTKDGKMLQVLNSHDRGVSCVTCLSNGLVVSGSYDNTIRIWDANIGQCLHILKGHSSEISCVEVLPDNRVVSGSYDNSIRIWDAITGICLKILEGHTSHITCVTALADNRVLSASADNTLRVWDLNTGQCLQLEGHEGEIVCIAVLSGDFVISGSADHTLRRWSIATGHCLQVFMGHSQKVTCIEVFSNGRIVSGSDDGTLRVWDVSTGRCLQVLEGTNAGITCMTVLPNKWVASGSKDKSIQIWKLGADTISGADPLSFVSILKESCLDYLNFLNSKSNSLFSRFSRLNENSFEMSLDTVFNNDSVYQDLMDFVQKYQYTCKPSYTIDFDWGLSSGEENMLRIFTNLYHIFDRDYSSGRFGDYKIYNNEAHSDEDSKKIECDSVLLFLDEADLTLHPEWQRRLIAILTTFIPQIYSSSCIKDIQIILSTHSPLILGDIPNENITYLYSNTEHDGNRGLICSIPSETFGQNIHTILKENFFLNNGTIGAFAARKINTVANRLAELKERKALNSDTINLNYEELSEIKQMIDLVAPGVLRAKLEMLFREVEAAFKNEERTKRREETANQFLKELRDLPTEERRRLLKAIEQEALLDD